MSNQLAQSLQKIGKLANEWVEKEKNAQKKEIKKINSGLNVSYDQLATSEFKNSGLLFVTNDKTKTKIINLARLYFFGFINSRKLSKLQAQFKQQNEVIDEDEVMVPFIINNEWTEVIASGDEAYKFQAMYQLYLQNKHLVEDQNQYTHDYLFKDISSFCKLTDQSILFYQTFTSGLFFGSFLVLLIFFEIASKF